MHSLFHLLNVVIWLPVVFIEELQLLYLKDFDNNEFRKNESFQVAYPMD